MNKKKIKVAVTGLNATDNPGSGVAVIRALKKSDYFDVSIIGLSYGSLEPAIYMRDLVDKTYNIPYISADTENLVSRLKYINEKEKIDVLIPNFDAELLTFINIKNRIKEIGINIFLPSVKQFEERSKANLYNYGQKYNVDVAYSRNIFSPDEAKEITKDFTYPVVVKGKFYDAEIAYNYEHLTIIFNKFSYKWGLPVIIQQFIAGTEYNVAALGDGEGNIICSVSMRKQFITEKGKAWAGITVDEPELIKITHKIISKTKWRGGFELELMKTKNNKFYILEINPRIPAWIYLAVEAGQNIPEALVKLALGEHVEPYKKFIAGKMFIRYSWDMPVVLDDFEKFSVFGEL